MFYEFLHTNREQILERAREKVMGEYGGSHRDAEGLPLFFDQLVYILRNKVQQQPPSREEKGDLLTSATVRGADLHKTGVTLGMVVHSYGTICDTVTEIAAAGRFSIEPHEFNTLNVALDDAIAEAVKEHTRLGEEALHEEARLRLGTLAHELRNELSCASLATSVLKQGRVSIQSNTFKLLERSLVRLTSLVDRSVAEVRLRTEPELQMEQVGLISLLNEVEATANLEASAHVVRLRFEVAPADIDISADRQLLLSAISNLVLNGIKYSRRGGTVTTTASIADDRAVIEVHDECGGLPPGMAEELFQPFVRGAKAEDRLESGLGLGLAIVRRAIQAHGGIVRVRNDPPRGCVFRIDVPQRLDRA